MDNKKYLRPIKVYQQYTNSKTHNIAIGFKLNDEFYVYNETFKILQKIKKEEEVDWTSISTSPYFIPPTKLAKVTPFSGRIQSLIGVFEVEGENYSFINSDDTIIKIGNDNITDVTITNDSSSYFLALLGTIPSVLLYFAAISFVLSTVIFVISQPIITFISSLLALVFVVFTLIISYSRIEDNTETTVLKFAGAVSLLMRKELRTLHLYDLPYYKIGRGGICVIGMKIYSIGLLEKESRYNDLETNILSVLGTEYYKKNEH